jgi:hypothetical protein
MPNEIVELYKQATASSAERAARQDRRQKRRARVSREMRIRPANFLEGSFEEVRSTMNLSRDGLYFLTPHDRYRMGMRLCIAAAAESATGSTWEQVGEVVRVHRRDDGFGVAVALTSPSTRSVSPAGYEPTTYAPANSAPVKKGERRSNSRRPFIASTEVIDVYTGARSQVSTADLSILGCYIDTVTPLPLDATALLQIEKDHATVEFRARVISSHPGSGMGLVFEGITNEQRALLGKWLRGDSAQLAPISSGLPSSAEGNEGSEEDTRFAKLLDVLNRKGILNESDVASLLRDL